MRVSKLNPYLEEAIAADGIASILDLTWASPRRARFLHRDNIDPAIGSLARDLVDDWVAVVAFADSCSQPPTNDGAERALGRAVIAPRISYGTSRDEGTCGPGAARGVIATRHEV